MLLGSQRNGCCWEDCAPKLGEAWLETQDRQFLLATTSFSFLVEILIFKEKHE